MNVFAFCFFHVKGWSLNLLATRINKFDRIIKFAFAGG